MPTLEEILEAKRKAKAKAQLVGSPASASAPASGAPVPVQVPVQVVPAPTQAQAQAPIIAIPTEPIAEPTTEPVQPEEQQAPSQFATSLADKLRSMAQEQDWLDVEQSANSLSEILSVIFALPYPPDVFIDECIDNAASALEAQKNQYLRDVLNGKKQSGKKVKPVQSVTTAAAIDSDDLFVLGM